MNYEKLESQSGAGASNAGVAGMIAGIRPQVDFRRLAVNEGLATENARLREENKRMRAAIDQISGTLAILKSSAP
jgi:fructose-1-phosphate kinase PfkB-like protein